MAGNEQGSSAKQISQQLAAWQELKPEPGTCDVPMLTGLLEGAKFCGRELYGEETKCFWHHPDDSKYKVAAEHALFGADCDLKDALAAEAEAGRRLDYAYLRNANIGGSFVRSGPNLSNIKLFAADLQGCSLSYCNLSGAQLAGANLQRAKLSQCILSKANLHRAQLFEAKFRNSDLSEVLNLRQSNFRGVTRKFFLVYRMLEDYPDQAAPMYLELSRYFSGQGLFADASWAAYRASVMRHKLLRKRATYKNLRLRVSMRALYSHPLLFDPEESNSLIEWLYNLKIYLASLMILSVTGYGEKPIRVVATAFLVILVYSFVYLLPYSATSGDFANSLYFSLITFTTLGYGDITPHGLYRFVAGSEALSGILLTGLFLFCFGRRSTQRL